MSNLKKQIEKDIPRLDQLIQAQTELTVSGELNTRAYDWVINEMMASTKRWFADTSLRAAVS